MSGIRSKDTKPELMLRRGLHARGFRFRLHQSDLPGKPDIVLRKHHAVVFVHGCFWHGHGCSLFKWPSTKAEFWRGKIEGNRRRDQNHIDCLTKLGWRTAIVWECALRGKHQLGIGQTVDEVEAWLLSQRPTVEVSERV